MRLLLVWTVCGLVACEQGTAVSPALPPPLEAPSPGRVAQPPAPTVVLSPPTASDLPAIDRPKPVPPSTRDPAPEDFKPSTPMAAPAEVVSFLRAHASGAKPWQATVYELDGAGDGFAGYRVVSTNTAKPELVNELVARLSNNYSSYVSTRCEGEPPLGVRLERDGAVLSFVADCRLRIDGTRDVAGLSPEMLGFMRQLDAKTAPCRWVRLDYFDLELCVDKTMRYSGGLDVMSLSGFASCEQITISDWPLSGGKDTRRVGTVEVSCSPRDIPGCAAICDSLRPTPNSTATASFPEGLPVIRSMSSLGLAGGGGTTKIWRDGTVVFDGNGCPKLRGARTKITPAKVTELIVRLALEARFGQGAPPDCDDCPYTLVVMQAGNDFVELYGPAATLVIDAVGPNPCQLPPS